MGGFIGRSMEKRGGMIGGATYNAFENPSVPLSSVALDQPYGRGPADIKVSVDGAFGLPIFTRCVGLISGLAATCEIAVLDKKNKKPFTIPVLDPDNDDTTYTQYELIELIMVHLLVWGNAFVQKVRDNGGRIIDLKPINPALVTVKPVDGDKVFEVKQPGLDGKLSRIVPLTTFEVMHIPGLGYNGLVGMGVVAYASKTLATTMQADSLAASFYSKGSALSGIINVKAPLANQEQADAIRKRWLSKNSGVAHSAEVAVLDADTTFQPITIPPDQLQFLDSRTFQRTEVATWFGVPPFLVNDTDKQSSWGSGIEQVNTMFVLYTMKSWFTRISQRMRRELVPVPGKRVKFLDAHLQRGDSLERSQVYASAIQWGWMTRNEARISENLMPIDGLDLPLTPINMQAGQVKPDPMTGQETPAPKGDLDGPLTSTVKPGSGQAQSESEVGTN